LSHDPNANSWSEFQAKVAKKELSSQGLSQILRIQKYFCFSMGGIKGDVNAPVLRITVFYRPQTFLQLVCLIDPVSRLRGSRFGTATEPFYLTADFVGKDGFKFRLFMDILLPLFNKCAVITLHFENPLRISLV
jgi:hypothetical protein